MPLTGNWAVSLIAKLTSATDFSTAVYEPTVRATQALTSGTGAGQADLLFADVRTVAGGANDDLDLAGGLTDVYGNTITMAELVGVLLINAPQSGTANTTDLTLGGGSNPVAGFLGGTAPTIGPIKPGGVLFIGASDAAGLGVVTAGTGDILRISNSAGASATYQVAILGRSA